jgi:hypothetical protein
MTEVAHIFRQYGEAYRSQHALSPNQVKAMNAIEICRTSQLGGHVDACNECGHTKISYNSCRNRHCPKCLNMQKERWLEERKRDLLPAPYFHIVFTLPDDLNAITLQNQKEVYAILFRASAKTLQELTKDPAHLGAEIGFISILHTWGQNLQYHPHLHCIVTGGGLSLDQKRWVPSKSNFFLPVKVLSRLFRGKFLQGLKKADFFLRAIGTAAEPQLRALISTLFTKEWVVYCKEPFDSPGHVLGYLGRYTHKVAISNHRVCTLVKGKVTFKWRDYKDGRKNKKMQIEAFEFIRRFMLHILPPGFVKIRHYGLLSLREKAKITRCKELLGIPVIPSEETKKKETWQELILRLTHKDPTLCSQCKCGRYHIQHTLLPTRDLRTLGQYAYANTS